jgi:hypothetical protein
VENFAAKQEQQTLANSWAHLYLLLGDSKVSSMHCQSPVQYSEKQYSLPRSQKRRFQALAAQSAHCREFGHHKDGTSRE